MEDETGHYCVSPECGPDDDEEDFPTCVESDLGVFWFFSGRPETPNYNMLQVAYCPFCGTKSPEGLGEIEAASMMIPIG